MQNHTKFIRAATAVSKEQALKLGLALYNETSKPATDTGTPPGVFFHPGNKDEKLTLIEEKAKSIGEISKKIPVVLELHITPENFSVLRGRMNLAQYHSSPYGDVISYTPVKNYSDLENNQYVATIRMEDLTHEDLVKLGVNVGFIDEDGNFDYKKYKDWSEVLGVRAKTREEMEISREINKEGNPSQMLK